MTDSIVQGAEHDFTIFQGGNFAEVCEYCEADGVTPIPLTGYTAIGQIRRFENSDSEKYADLTIVIDEPAGRLTVTLSAEDTASIPRSGFYDIFLVSGSQKFLLLQGRAILDHQVTQQP